MDLDARHTRGLFLAGTVAFPTPFPTTGTISLDVGHLTYSPGEAPKEKDLLTVYEYRRDRSVVRTMLQEDVAAVFIPGVWDENKKKVFRISDEPRLDDLEKGEWFLDTDVNPGAIRKRLYLKPEIDISTHNSRLRGIVFVAEDRPVKYTIEASQPAGADEELSGFPRAHGYARICCSCC
jgi:hypothetical protein